MTVKHERQVLRQARIDREERDYAQHIRNAKLAALATPGLAALLGRLANCTSPSEHGNAPDVRQCIKDRKAAHALATRIREVLAQEEAKCTD